VTAALGLTAMALLGASVVLRLLARHSERLWSAVQTLAERAERLAQRCRLVSARRCHRCTAHGRRACAECSAHPGDCLSDTGGCGMYVATGMHWDTCPNRVRR
jgi:hypothetical protein